MCYVASYDILHNQHASPPRRFLQAELGEDAGRIKFTTSDLENLSGEYDTVLCIDVMIHYPTDKASAVAVNDSCSGRHIYFRLVWVSGGMLLCTTTGRFVRKSANVEEGRRPPTHTHTHTRRAS